MNENEPNERQLEQVSKARLNAYLKLMNIQQKLKVPKGKYNDFGKYNYRTAEDILQAAKPLLAECKAIILLQDEIITKGDQGTSKSDGCAETTAINYVCSTAEFIDIETGEMITTTAYAREGFHKGMSADQCTGCASSYARKYALNALLCIDNEEGDSDSLDNRESGNNHTNNANSTKTNGGWGNKSANANANSNGGKGGWGKP